MNETNVLFPLQGISLDIVLTSTIPNYSFIGIPSERNIKEINWKYDIN